MQRQPDYANRLTLAQKIAIAQNLSFYPALTVMVFLRQGIGFRLLNPLHVLATAALMAMGSALARENPFPQALPIYAALFVVVALGHRVKGWWKFQRGAWKHSYDPGDSLLERLPLPTFLRRSHRVGRFLDPLLAVGLGYLLFDLCPPVGGWLMFAGVCLRAFEHAIHTRRIERELDTLDGLIASQRQAEAVERFAGSSMDSSASAHPETIPTGLSEDLKAKTNRRRKPKHPGQTHGHS